MILVLTSTVIDGKGMRGQNQLGPWLEKNGDIVISTNRTSSMINWDMINNDYTMIYWDDWILHGGI